MCRDICYERCYGLQFRTFSKFSYDVIQVRHGVLFQLGRVCRCGSGAGWFFKSWVYPYTCSHGSTRIKALRYCMNDFVIQCPLRNVPLFDRCDCLSSGKFPDENKKDNDL